MQKKKREETTFDLKNQDVFPTLNLTHKRKTTQTDSICSTVFYLAATFERGSNKLNES